jgi:hypothetical protein
MVVLRISAEEGIPCVSHDTDFQRYCGSRVRGLLREDASVKLQSFGIHPVDRAGGGQELYVTAITYPYVMVTIVEPLEHERRGRH